MKRLKHLRGTVKKMIYDAPGVSGEASKEESGPVWYSPLSINIPSWTKEIRTNFQGIFDIIKPIVEIQKLKYDIFGPILDSFSKKIDVFEIAVSTIKSFVESMITDFESLINRSGFYVLITVPDFVVKRYVWLPAVHVVDNTSVELDPTGIPISESGSTPGLGNPLRGQVTIDEDGGFFSVNENEYRKFIEGSKIKVKTGRGPDVEIDKDSSTVFFSVGSTGVKGFLDKFDKSFSSSNTSSGTSTAQGKRNDLAIPKFQSGDVVSGLTFMITAPGFNNLMDSVFRVANVFVPGNRIRRALREVFPSITESGASEYLLKRTKLEAMIEPPSYRYKKGEEPEPGSDRKTIKEAMDFDEGDHEIQATFRTRSVRKLKNWRVSIWMKVTDLKSDPEDIIEDFDYGNSPAPTPDDKGRFNLSGYKKVAMLHEDSFFGESGIITIDEEHGYEKDTIKDTAFNDYELINGNEKLAFNKGVKISIPIDYFDAKYEIKFTLEALYNRGWTPEGIMGNMASKILDQFPELNMYVPVGQIIKDESALDVFTNGDIQSFDDMTGKTVNKKLVEEATSRGLPSIKMQGDMISPTYSQGAKASVKTTNGLLGFSLEDTNEERDANLAQELYLNIKLGTNPRGNYWVDELHGKSLYKDVENKVQKQIEEKQKFGTETDWQVVDQFNKTIKPSLPSRSGIVTGLSKVKFGKKSVTRDINLGIGIPDFRMDRWFAINVNAMWPELSEFIGKFKEFVSSINLTFPEIKSPYLDFVKSIFEELNKIIRKINSVLETVLAITETLELLTSEFIHVLRIEDELGKGYTTGGISKIKEIIKKSPGLPEFLIGDKALVTGNITGEGIEGRKDRPKYFTEDSHVFEEPPISEAPETTAITSKNIQVSDQRDDFVASITILTGVPSTEDPVSKSIRTTKEAVERFRNFDFAVFEEREEITVKLTGISVKLTGLEASKNSLQASIDNAESLNIPEGELVNIKANLASITEQISTLQQQYDDLNNRATEIDELQGDLVGKFKEELGSEELTKREQAIANTIKKPFDWIEEFVFQTTASEKKEIVKSFE